MKPAGQPVPHESAHGHVTGRALYTDDLCPRFPNLLHAWPVTAPHAHARLLSLDVTPALDMPGVAAVLTASDVPGLNDTGPARRDEPLFPDEVQHHGQAVAWVLAETEEQARQAADRVVAGYLPLEATLTIEDAIGRGSFHAGPLSIERGEASAAITASPHRLTGELRIGGQEHFYLETQAAIAWLDETGGIALHSSTQHPSETQEIVARVLGIARHNVTVECLRMGGAFGGKETQGASFAAVAALGAWKTGRPVRVRLPRRLDFILTGKRHPFLARYEAGFDDEGVLRGVRIRLYSDGGWSADLSEAVLGRAMFHCDNAYFVPAMEVTGFVCKTHKTSQTAFRGFGGPQGMLVIEDIIDRAARTLGLPPDIVRERNFYREGDETHYGQPVKDAERIARIWRELKASSDFYARRRAVDEFNRTQTGKRRGIAITPVKFGISFTATYYNQAGAMILVYRDGSVQVNHGGTEMGQGLYTKIRQVAATALGIPPESVRLTPTRTDKVPNTSATAASSSADLNGAAVLDACSKLRATLAEVAGRMLGCSPADVQFEGGQVTALGRHEAARAFHEIVEKAYKERMPLFASGFYRTPEIQYDPLTMRGRPFHYFAYGAAVSEVEIDIFTGQHRILRADLLEDAGESLSPLIDRGQIEGGFVQGAGWLTLEELLWDEKGRISTAGASTYKLPSWSEMPEDFRVAFLERAAEPGVVFGSKAVGEPPLMLAISVRGAIRDAIASCGSGPVEIDSPCTPERIFFAIQAARESAAEPNVVPAGVARS